MCSVFSDTRKTGLSGHVKEASGERWSQAQRGQRLGGLEQRDAAVLPSGLRSVPPLYREPSLPAAARTGRPVRLCAVAGLRAPAGEAAHPLSQVWSPPPTAHAMTASHLSCARRRQATRSEMGPHMKMIFWVGWRTFPHLAVISLQPPRAATTHREEACLSGGSPTAATSQIFLTLSSFPCCLPLQNKEFLLILCPPPPRGLRPHELGRARGASQEGAATAAFRANLCLKGPTEAKSRSRRTLLASTCPQEMSVPLLFAGVTPGRNCVRETSR